MTAVLFQNMPPLSPEEYAALEASILEHGIQSPVIVDEDGVVIDGHHRSKIASEHDLPVPKQTVRGKTEAEKRTLALSLNLDRRHLNREQRRALIAESIKADPAMSNREHARRTGVDHKTVAAIREPMVESGEIPHFSERLDPRTGNLSQPATRTFQPRPASEDLNAEPTSLANVNTPKKRRPITDQAAELGWEFRKAADKLHRLLDDDRFTRNKEEVTAHLRGHLTYTVEACNALLEH